MQIHRFLEGQDCIVSQAITRNSSASPNHLQICIVPETLNIIIGEAIQKTIELCRLGNEADLNKKQQIWTTITGNEMYAFLGILLFAGVFHAFGLRT